MNHELLLNTELPVTAKNSAAQHAAISDPTGSEGKAAQAFSSELDKQLDKQTTNQQSEINTAEGNQQTTVSQTQPQQEAETGAIENGNSLPRGDSDETLVDDVIASLLDEFPSLDSVNLKESLSPLIDKLVEFFQQTDGGEESLVQDITQILEHLMGVLPKTPAAQQAFAKFNNAHASQPIENFIDKLLVKSEASTATPLGKAEQLATALESKDNPKDNSLLHVIAATANKGKVNSTTSQADSEKSSNKVLAQTLVEQIQTVVKQIKEFVANERSGNADIKTDVVRLVSDVVKRIVLPMQAKHQGAEEVVSTTPVIQLQEEQQKLTAKIRPDILQALSQRVAKETNDSMQRQGQTQFVVKDEFINLDEKRGERSIQLVDLLKPAKQESALPRPVADKGFANIMNPVLASSILASSAESAIKTGSPLLDIQPSIQSQAWSRVLGSRVIWMAREGIQQVALQLNPAHLGPVEVRLSMHNEQANIMFVAQHAATRDALEQALPKLRESFSENGLELASADVSEQASQQTEDDETETENTMLANAGIILAETDETEQQQGSNAQDNEVGVSVYA